VASSCLAPPVADQTLAQDIAGAVAAVRTECGALAEYLDQVVDHRSRPGLRYELGFLLGVVVAATACAGHDEVTAQAQWAADAPQWVLTALGAEPAPLTGAITAPSESTLRRALARVDAADLQRLTAQWAVGLTEALRRATGLGTASTFTRKAPSPGGQVSEMVGHADQ